MIATLYTDKTTGKQYRVTNSASARVQQYPCGAVVHFDGSSDKQSFVTNMKTRSALNSWLKMMGFKK